MRRSRSLALAIVAVTMASCGSSGKPSSNAVGTGPAGNLSGAPSAPASTGLGGSTTSGTTTGSTPASGAPSAPAKPGASANANATPTPVATSFDPKSHQATPQELPIAASITPNCVLPGMPVTLEVKTKPKASIAFVAVYHGDKSGAAPPWGEGYGGNDKGEASEDGKWSSTWVVAANTPRGPARVMLVVGINGKQRTIEVPFSVGEREVGGCGA